MKQCAKEERIKEINSNGLAGKFASLLKEITLITGLKAPTQIIKNDKGENEEDAGPFVILFTQFLLAHYGIITCSEVKLAFRLNAAGDLPGTTGGKETDRIDFYGSILTLEHLGGVLSRYMSKRSKLALKIAEKAPTKVEAPAPSLEQQEMDDKKLANEYYKKWLNDEFTLVSIEYAYLIYDVLDHFKIIQLTNLEKHEWFSKAQEMRKQEVSLLSVNRKEREGNMKLLSDYLGNFISAPEQALVKTYAKRLALLDFFEKLKLQKKEKIF